VKRAIAFAVCFAIGVAIAFVRGNSDDAPPPPRDAWAEKYAEFRKRNSLTKWPELARTQLPGFSIAVPAGAALTDSQLALGEIKDLVKPRGSGVIVWWREAVLTSQLPLAGDPIATVLAWSRDMGDAGVRVHGVPQPSLTYEGAYDLWLRARAQHTAVRYFPCGKLVVAVIAWHDTLPIGNHIAESFRCGS
jgi:hypothetical protein